MTILNLGRRKLQLSLVPNYCSAAVCFAAGQVLTKQKKQIYIPKTALFLPNRDTRKIVRSCDLNPCLHLQTHHHRTESSFGAVVFHMDRASDLVEMLIF